MVAPLRYALRKCCGDQAADAQGFDPATTSTQPRNAPRQLACGFCLWPAFSHEAFIACVNVLTLPTQTALLHQDCQHRCVLRLPAMGGGHDHMRKVRRQRQAGKHGSVRRNPSLRVQCVHRHQQLTRLLHCGGRRQIKPTEFRRIIFAPARTIEQDRRKVAFKNLGRVEWRQAPIARLLPQPIGNPCLLSGGTPGTLCCGRQACTLGD